MKSSDEECSVKVIEFCRRMNRSAAGKYAELGVTGEDIAIGGLYSLFDLALGHTGNPVAALDWLRRGVDVLAEEFLIGAETMQ